MFAILPEALLKNASLLNIQKALNKFSVLVMAVENPSHQMKHLKLGPEVSLAARHLNEITGSCCCCSESAHSDQA